MSSNNKIRNFSVCNPYSIVTIRCNPSEKSLLWIVTLVHSFWIGGGFTPVGADLEEVVVEGVAYFEEDIGIDPFAAHDLVEVLAGVADLLRQPGDASALPRKLRLDGLPDVKGFDRGFVVVHCSIRFGTFTLTPRATKKALAISLSAY